MPGGQQDDIIYKSGSQCSLGARPALGQPAPEAGTCRCPICGALLQQSEQVEAVGGGTRRPSIALILGPSPT